MISKKEGSKKTGAKKQPSQASTKQVPQTTDPNLPKTLARRLQTLRESMNLTADRLAEKAMVSRQTIDDIESGLETFLAPAIRQKLARALRVRVGVLQEVEKRPELKSVAPAVAPPEVEQDLLQAMMENPSRTYFCPLCGEKLVVRLFDRFDLHNNPILALKAHCSRCLFKLENN